MCILYLQLEDGDIVCFQKAPPVDGEEHFRYPDVPSYLEYVHNRQVLLYFSLLNAAVCLILDYVEMKSSRTSILSYLYLKYHNLLLYTMGTGIYIYVCINSQACKFIMFILKLNS